MACRFVSVCVYVFQYFYVYNCMCVYIYKIYYFVHTALARGSTVWPIYVRCCIILYRRNSRERTRCPKNLSSARRGNLIQPKTEYRSKSSIFFHFFFQCYYYYCIHIQVHNEYLKYRFKLYNNPYNVYIIINLQYIIYIYRYL